MPGEVIVLSSMIMEQFCYWIRPQNQTHRKADRICSTQISNEGSDVNKYTWDNLGFLGMQWNKLLRNLSPPHRRPKRFVSWLMCNTKCSRVIDFHDVQEDISWHSIEQVHSLPRAHTELQSSLRRRLRYMQMRLIFFNLFIHFNF
jgi:hypothetical protein